MTTTTIVVVAQEKAAVVQQARATAAPATRPERAQAARFQAAVAPIKAAEQRLAAGQARVKATAIRPAEEGQGPNRARRAWDRAGAGPSVVVVPAPAKAAAAGVFPLTAATPVKVERSAERPAPVVLVRDARG